MAAPISSTHLSVTHSQDPIAHHHKNTCKDFAEFIRNYDIDIDTEGEIYKNFLLMLNSQETFNTLLDIATYETSLLRDIAYFLLDKKHSNEDRDKVKNLLLAPDKTVQSVTVNDKLGTQEISMPWPITSRVIGQFISCNYYLADPTSDEVGKCLLELSKLLFVLVESANPTARTDQNYFLTTHNSHTSLPGSSQQISYHENILKNFAKFIQNHPNIDTTIYQGFFGMLSDQEQFEQLVNIVNDNIIQFLKKIADHFAAVDQDEKLYLKPKYILLILANKLNIDISYDRIETISKLIPFSDDISSFTSKFLHDSLLTLNLLFEGLALAMADTPGKPSTATTARAHHQQLNPPSAKQHTTSPEQGGGASAKFLAAKKSSNATLASGHHETLFLPGGSPNRPDPAALLCQGELLSGINPLENIKNIKNKLESTKVLTVDSTNEMCKTYIALGDAYMTHDIKNAINAYKSALEGYLLLNATKEAREIYTVKIKPQIDANPSEYTVDNKYFETILRRLDEIDEVKANSKDAFKLRFLRIANLQMVGYGELQKPVLEALLFEVKTFVSYANHKYIEVGMKLKHISEAQKICIYVRELAQKDPTKFTNSAMAKLKNDFEDKFKKCELLKKTLEEEDRLIALASDGVVGLSYGVNNCFINCTFQFILNNPALIKACLNHQDAKFRELFRKTFIANEKTPFDKNMYPQLINYIREKYYEGSRSQQSATELLDTLFGETFLINCTKYLLPEDLNKYSVFKLLSTYTNSDALLAIVNSFPIEGGECKAYDQLRHFILNTPIIVKNFRDLVDNKNYIEFKKSITDNKQNLSLLEKLIAHPIFQNIIANQFTWFDTATGMPLNLPARANAIMVYKGVMSYTSSSGHYICYVKKSETWYKCDDSTVSKLATDDIPGKVLTTKDIDGKVLAFTLG